MSLEGAGLGRRVGVYARLAHFILWAETAVAAFWSAATLAGGFAALALFGVISRLSPIAHLVLLIVFVLLQGALIWSGSRRFVRPTRSAAFRRIERDSLLPHRPFETLSDRPVNDGDSAVSMLWRLHQERNRATLRGLHLSLPNARLAERDPRAVRMLVALMLVLGFIIAGANSGRLLSAALAPNLSFGGGKMPIEAWIRPPAYTGAAPILLDPASGKTEAIPIGSTLEAHVTGGSHAPHLLYDGHREDFRSLDGGGFALNWPLAQPGTVSIRRGWLGIAKWPIEIIPDNPPTISFTASPTLAQSGALKIDYRATDDYGVAQVDLRVRQAPDQPAIAAEPIAATLVAGRTDKELTGASFQDLTAHPWAGMRVLAKLVATDTAGQVGTSEEIALTLPERNFTQPAARAIADARKHLIRGDAPRSRIAGDVAGLARAPELYGGDFAVFLALTTAATELDDAMSDDSEALATIEDLLWNAALKIEEGDKPEAEKALRAAEDELEKALKDPNATAAEIARLTQNLKDAMNRAIQAMAEKMRQQLARGEKLDIAAPDENTRTYDQSELNDQIDKMTEMARNGSREAAANMLSSLKSLLENLQTGMQAGDSNPEGMKSLQELKDLAQKQRALERSGAPNAAQQQDALRQSLGDTAQRIGEAMGKIPPSLGSADRAMREAGKSLRSGGPGDATENFQEDAAGQLDQAAQSLAEQLSQQGATTLTGKSQAGRDPFGRGRASADGDVKVPTDREMQRSREVLEELRRRASEHDRPRMELDYFGRLLRQY